MKKLIVLLFIIVSTQAFGLGYKDRTFKFFLNGSDVYVKESQLAFIYKDGNGCIGVPFGAMQFDRTYDPDIVCLKTIQFDSKESVDKFVESFGDVYCISSEGVKKCN